MKCDRIKLILGRYVDDRLTALERAEIEEHLTGCAECRAYYQDLLKLDASVEKLQLGGDEEYWLRQKDAILGTIGEIEASTVVKLPKKKRTGLPFKLAAIAASVTLVAYISIHESKVTKPTRALFTPQALPSLSTVKPSMPETTKAAEHLMIEKRASDTGARTSPKSTIISMEPEKREIPVVSPITVTQSAESMVAGEKPMVFDAVTPAPDTTSRISETKKMEQALNRTAPEPARESLLKTEGKSVSLVKPEEQKGRKSVTLPEISDLKTDLTSANRQMNQKSQSNAIIPAASDSSDMIAYVDWRRQTEYLEAMHGQLLTSEGKGISSISSSQKTDSLKQVLLDMAEAYYNVGRLTPDKDERYVMLGKLQTLAARADSSCLKTIQDYITALDSLTK